MGGRASLALFCSLVASASLCAENAKAPLIAEDVAALYDTITKKGAATVDAAIPHLPEALRRSYTLMYESGSRQSTTSAAPRAILFGKDASLVVTFNGDDKQDGGRSLEIAKYRDNPPRLELYEIRFPEGGKGKAVLSGPNPDACRGCHGHPPRYRWDSYATWKGAYGSHDDEIDTASAEGKDYLAFRATRDRHPRYRYLLDPAFQPTAVAPYFDRKEHKRDRILGNMPNSRLSLLLGLRAAKLGYARLAASPRFSRLAPLLAAVIAPRCPSPDAATAKVFAATIADEERKAKLPEAEPTVFDFSKQAGRNAARDRLLRLLQTDWRELTPDIVKGLAYDNAVTSQAQVLLGQLWPRVQEAAAALKEPMPDAVPYTLATYYPKAQIRPGNDAYTVHGGFDITDADRIASLGPSVDAPADCDRLYRIALGHLQRPPGPAPRQEAHAARPGGRWWR